jgi:hypothetical protein
MSLYIFGPRHHAPACARSGGRPPVICGCRVLDIQPASDEDERMEVTHTRKGLTLTALFRPIDRTVA